MRVDEALKELERVRRRLQPNQARGVRRNARRAFLGAMKALRNALNADYPRIEPPTDPEKYVVDIFEPSHREGAGRRSRMLKERWRIVRRTDFAGMGTPAAIAFFTKTNQYGRTIHGSMLSTNVHDATKFAAWAAKRVPNRQFRLRKTGEREGLVADIL